MPSARDPDDFLKDVTVQFDGIEPFRRAPAWSRDKLGILAMYLPKFAEACSKRAPDFYFVDGLAAEGLYYFASRDTYALGSTLIALQAKPSFAKVLSMDLSRSKVEALKARTEKFRPRSIVVQGDCNSDLLKVMEEHIPRRAPVLVFMDPEGLELEWYTVQSLSEFRQGQRKAELLILVPTGSVGRVAEVAHDSTDEGANRIDFMFPYPSGWNDVWQRRQRDEISAAASRDAFAQIYCAGLTDLGYIHVESRAITTGEADGASVYHLVFASDHPAGERIMRHVFQKMYSNTTRSRNAAPNQATLFDL